jgi:hypothetical protein
MSNDNLISLCCPNTMFSLKKISLIQMLERGMLRRIYNDGSIICKYLFYSYSNIVHHKWFPCYYINSCLNTKNIILTLTKMQIH